jgi:HEAT repeat protein
MPILEVGVAEPPLVAAEVEMLEPVEGLRQALQPPSEAYLIKGDAELAKRLKDANSKDEQGKILAEARARDVAGRIDALGNLAELRQAFLLSDWGYQRQDWNSGDRKLHARLTQRLAKALRQKLQGGDTTGQLAALAMIVDLRPDAQSGVSWMVLSRSLVPDVVVVLLKGRQPEVRVAAARTLSKMDPDPKEALQPLKALLQAQTAAERQSAAAALSQLLRSAREQFQHEDRFGGERPEEIPEETGNRPRRVDNPREAGAIGKRRQALIQLGTDIVPILALRFRDDDGQVRQACWKALLQAAQCYAEMVPDPVNYSAARRPALSEPEYRRLVDHRKALLPLARALNTQLTGLADGLRDNDLGVCLAAHDVLETMAGARLDFLRKASAVAEAAKELDAGKPLQDTVGEGVQKLLPTLGTELTHEEVRVRLASLYVLETLEGEAGPVAGAIVQALKDDNAFVRWGAVRALGRMAPREAARAVPGLATQVNDKHRDVRLAALAALERYGPHANSAVPVISRALFHKDADTRFWSARALAAIGKEATTAVPALAKSLADPEPDVRYEAVKALAKMGPTALTAVDALQKALEDPDIRVRQVASDILASGK